MRPVPRDLYEHGGTQCNRQRMTAHSVFHVLLVLAEGQRHGGAPFVHLAGRAANCMAGRASLPCNRNGMRQHVLNEVAHQRRLTEYIRYGYS
jgi:hypothetical protein